MSALPERILVTGGAGFIGSHTVDALLALNKSVVVLDNLSSGHLTNLPLSHPNLEFIEGDILELPLVIDLVKHCDAVMHLAAIASVPQSIAEPVYTFQVNTQGHLHVLEAIRLASRPIKLVYASSAAVYGDNPQLPCDDQQPLLAPPLSPYALHKLHNESYAALYLRMHQLSSIGLRYFNAYGARQDPASPYSGVISKFLSCFRDQQAITLFGDGEQARDFIAVQDIVAANLLALQSKTSGIYNIATGTAKTLLQLIDAMQAASGFTPQIQYQPARSGDIKTSYAKTTHASASLGFTAQTSLEMGIKALLAPVTNS